MRSTNNIHAPKTNYKHGTLLNILLLISFVVTNLAPFTGTAVHKMASTVFLILCVIHTVIYRKRFNGKRIALLVAIVLAFVSGVFGMVLDHIPMISGLHTVISIGCVFFLAIHIFVFQRGLKWTERKSKV